jgi:hypothetical protein
VTAPTVPFASPASIVAFLIKMPSFSLTPGAKTSGAAGSGDYRPRACLRHPRTAARDQLGHCGQCVRAVGLSMELPVLR